MEKIKIDELRFIRKFLSYLLRYRGLFFVSIILLFLDTVSGVISPVIIKKTVDSAIPTGKAEKIFIFSGIIFLVIIVASFSRFLLVYFTNKVGQKVLQDIRQEIFSTIMRLPMKFFDNTQTGKIVIRLTNDVENLNELFVSGLITFIADIMIIFGVISVMFALDVKLSLIALSTFPPMILVTIFFREKASKVYSKIRKKIAELNSFMTESIKGVKTIKVLPAYIYSVKKFGEINESYFAISGKAIKLFSFFFSSIIAFSSLSLASVIWYGGIKIIDGALSFGTFLGFWYAVNKLFDPIWDFSEKYNILQSATASAKRIFEILEEEKEDRKWKRINEKEERKSSIRLKEYDCDRDYNSVEFKDVFFSYDGVKYILKGASFFIPPKSTVSIVGLTGVGKTTIANLLTGMYIPEKGEILLGGKDIREIPLAELRRKVAYISQDVFMFKGKVIDNITLWQKDENHSEKIDFIKNIIGELGLEIDLYREIGEMGQGLSSGEKQIISILRAIYFNSSVIIFDEATAFLDFEMERKIEKVLEKIKGEKTLIKIAHRLSAIKSSDKVILVENGKTIEMLPKDFSPNFYASIHNNR